MSNQRFLKIVCFRFPTYVPKKKSNIFVFETKFIIEPKRSLSDLKLFGLYSNVLLLLKTSWKTSKSFGFVPKVFEKIKTFCFCKKEVGTHQKVLILFQNFWNKQKRSTLGSGTHLNVFSYPPPAVQRLRQGVWRMKYYIFTDIFLWCIYTK